MLQEIWFDKYRLIKLLGQGGTAKVYLAQHIKLNSFRAIKHISKHNSLYKRQLKEAHILKDLKHSCIPIVYDIEEDEDGSYIIEQYLEGETLSEFVSKRNHLNEDIIIHFALQLCDLIKYLHSEKRPILYIDLKPENIIISKDTLKLIDFGSAVFCDEVENNLEFYGTIGYAAPELYYKNRIDERCDVYGIGMLLYYMVTGKSISRPGEKIDHIDYTTNKHKKLKRIINKCLKYDPSQRYSSVLKLEQDLLASINKKTYKGIIESSIDIGIAGSQPRIGTTHMSLRICSYFNRHDRACLYLEHNRSRCLWNIRNRYYLTKKDQDVLRIKGIEMASAGYEQVMDLTEYNVIVRDYGCLGLENKDQFLQSKIKILILGSKDWELGYSEEALTMISEYKDIIFMFNFVDGRQYMKAIKSMVDRNCLRIPYEPDPFAKPRDKNSQEFFRDLLGLCIS
ncbi:MAG: serine/threonine protein kinase [Clostridiales bacterium]|jgi:serine/threonine-protein kinase|nr:serine/threonine-protein kinase [Bacillota bacterium]NLK04718.1 serine/threonine protein kinase [Clostridiales bacterium]